MSLLKPDVPVGTPPFELPPAYIATVIDLVCRGAYAARSRLEPGMWENPMTVIVRKEMRRIKASLELTNLEVWGEHQLDDMAKTDPTIRGRVDIVLKFSEQFGHEEDYVAIECKRVGARLSSLNVKFVLEGVDRFAKGQYAAGHSWGFMLGYVLALPLDKVTNSIDAKLRKTYGDTAKLSTDTAHELSLCIFESWLGQSGGHKIRLKHIFVDMTPAAESSTSSLP